MRAPVRTLALTATVTAALAVGGCTGATEAAPSGTPATTASTPASTPASTAASSPAAAPTSAAPTRKTHPPRPRPKPTRTRPALAGPGTRCGTFVVPGGKKPRPVLVTKGHLSCATAITTLKRYYAGVSKGRGGGNTATLEVGAYVCQSPTAATSAEEKTITVCSRPHAAFRVKTH